MTVWMVVGVLSLCILAPRVVRARQAARKPPFVSWVKVDTSPAHDPSTTPATAERRIDRPPDLAWTHLDERQLKRYRSESSY